MDRLEFNKQRMEELKKLETPLENFINTWCCPHDILIVQQGRIELFSGEVSINLDILD